MSRCFALNYGSFPARMSISSQSIGSIKILPALIAERIAAGEVIERPASVVKELVENSIDAGATRIEVRLQKGGCELIQVTDNGSGMAKEDLELCVCRHATSKIQNFEDLSALSTLGFRGEALPSIASVSELTILSRRQETFQIKAAHTAPVRAQAELMPNFNFLGDSHGTQIKVTSLFSQIPARLKFLKSAGSESSAVREILERLALTHPEISFSLFSDERALLNLPSENLKMRAERMLADGNPFEMLECKLDGGWSIHVLWLKGISVPHTRSMYQVVNGRALRDRILQQAILSPLRQSFLPGNFPAIIVNLNIPKDELDVNVHPTKTEIRFLDPKKIFALCHAALQKLLQDSTPKDFWQSTPTLGGFSNSLSTTEISSGLLPHQEYSPQSFESNFDASPFGQFRGILFQTYLTFEMGEELLLVDQHAAHERIRYEALKNKVLNREQIESQDLLIPELIKIDRQEMITLSKKLPLLEKLGFQCEVFGEDTVLFRAVPAVWGNFQLTERLKNLLVRLSLEQLDTTDKELVWDETLFEKVAMEACRSSVKAGDRMTEFGAVDLAQKLIHCEHPGNCPHGRPTFIKISKLKVEEWFSRKI